MEAISSLSRHQDTVEYHIYFDDIAVDPSNVENFGLVNSDLAQITVSIDGEPVTMSVSMYLLSMRSTFLKFVSPMLSKYLWASQPFNLQVWNPALQPQVSVSALDTDADSEAVVRNELSSHILNSFASSTSPHRTSTVKSKPHRFPNCPHLYGSLHFSDCLNDEWLVTYLLLTLTARFPFLTVRVTDATEHFLLAHCPRIPEWLDHPVRARHRLWLRAGHICLIPRPSPHLSIPACLSPCFALHYVRKYTKHCLLPHVLHRMMYLPLLTAPRTLLSENNVVIPVIIPVSVGYVLEAFPWMITYAVNALSEGPGGIHGKIHIFRRFLHNCSQGTRVRQMWFSKPENLDANVDFSGIDIRNYEIPEEGGVLSLSSNYPTITSVNVVKNTTVSAAFIPISSEVVNSRNKNTLEGTNSGTSSFPPVPARPTQMPFIMYNLQLSQLSAAMLERMKVKPPMSYLSMIPPSLPNIARSNTHPIDGADIATATTSGTLTGTAVCGVDGMGGCMSVPQWRDVTTRITNDIAGSTTTTTTTAIGTPTAADATSNQDSEFCTVNSLSSEQWRRAVIWGGRVTLGMEMIYQSGVRSREKQKSHKPDFSRVFGKKASAAVSTPMSASPVVTEDATHTSSITSSNHSEAYAPLDYTAAVSVTQRLHAATMAIPGVPLYSDAYAYAAGYATQSRAATGPTEGHVGDTDGANAGEKSGRRDTGSGSGSADVIEPFNKAVENTCVPLPNNAILVPRPLVSSPSHNILSLFPSAGAVPADIPHKDDNITAGGMNDDVPSVVASSIASPGDSASPSLLLLSLAMPSLSPQCSATYSALQVAQRITTAAVAAPSTTMSSASCSPCASPALSVAHLRASLSPALLPAPCPSSGSSSTATSTSKSTFPSSSSLPSVSAPVGVLARLAHTHAQLLAQAHPLTRASTLASADHTHAAHANTSADTATVPQVPASRSGCSSPAYLPLAQLYNDATYPSGTWPSSSLATLIESVLDANTVTLASVEKYQSENMVWIETASLFSENFGSEFFRPLPLLPLVSFANSQTNTPASTATTSLTSTPAGTSASTIDTDMTTDRTAPSTNGANTINFPVVSLTGPLAQLTSAASPSSPSLWALYAHLPSPPRWHGVQQWTNMQWYHTLLTSLTPQAQSDANVSPLAAVTSVLKGGQHTKKEMRAIISGSVMPVDVDVPSPIAYISAQHTAAPASQAHTVDYEMAASSLISYNPLRPHYNTGFLSWAALYACHNTEWRQICQNMLKKEKEPLLLAETWWRGVYACIYTTADDTSRVTKTKTIDSINTGVATVIDSDIHDMVVPDVNGNTTNATSTGPFTAAASSSFHTPVANLTESDLSAEAKESLDILRKTFRKSSTTSEIGEHSQNGAEYMDDLAADAAMDAAYNAALLKLENSGISQKHGKKAVRFSPPLNDVDDGDGNQENSDILHVKDSQDMEHMLSRLRDFMDSESGLDGVEFRNRQSTKNKRNQRVTDPTQRVMASVASSHQQSVPAVAKNDQSVNKMNKSIVIADYDEAEGARGALDDKDGQENEATGVFSDATIDQLFRASLYETTKSTSNAHISISASTNSTVIRRGKLDINRADADDVIDTDMVEKTAYVRGVDDVPEDIRGDADMEQLWLLISRFGLPEHDDHNNNILDDKLNRLGDDDVAGARPYDDEDGVDDSEDEQYPPRKSIHQNKLPSLLDKGASLASSTLVKRIQRHSAPAATSIDTNEDIYDVDREGEELVPSDFDQVIGLSLHKYKKMSCKAGEGRAADDDAILDKGTDSKEYIRTRYTLDSDDDEGGLGLGAGGAEEAREPARGGDGRGSAEVESDSSDDDVDYADMFGYSDGKKRIQKEEHPNSKLFREKIGSFGKNSEKSGIRELAMEALQSRTKTRPDVDTSVGTGMGAGGPLKRRGGRVAMKMEVDSDGAVGVSGGDGGHANTFANMSTDMSIGTDVDITSLADVSDTPLRLRDLAIGLTTATDTSTNISGKPISGRAMPGRAMPGAAVPVAIPRDVGASGGMGVTSRVSVFDDRYVDTHALSMQQPFSGPITAAVVNPGMTRTDATTGNAAVENADMGKYDMEVSLEEYMRLMDRELARAMAGDAKGAGAGAGVGKVERRSATRTQRAVSGDGGDGGDGLDYTDMFLDDDSDTGVRTGAGKSTDASASEAGAAEEEVEGEDVDAELWSSLDGRGTGEFDVLKRLMEAYEEEEGETGPLRTMFSVLGINMPENTSSENSGRKNSKSKHSGKDGM